MGSIPVKATTVSLSFLSPTNPPYSFHEYIRSLSDSSAAVIVRRPTGFFLPQIVSAKAAVAAFHRGAFSGESQQALNIPSKLPMGC